MAIIGSLAALIIPTVIGGGGAAAVGATAAAGTAAVGGIGLGGAALVGGGAAVGGTMAGMESHERRKQSQAGRPKRRKMTQFRKEMNAIMESKQKSLIALGQAFQEAGSMY